MYQKLTDQMGFPHACSFLDFQKAFDAVPPEDFWKLKLVCIL